MKIRNEPEHIADTIKSIFNWNDDHHEIGIPTNNGLIHGLRRHWISYPRESHSKYCIVLNLWNFDRIDHVDQQQHHHHQQKQPPQLQRTFIAYSLHKLTQLCLVIVLLLPFLMTYNALILGASGQFIVGPTTRQPWSLPNSSLSQITVGFTQFHSEHQHQVYNNKSNESRSPINGYNRRSHGYSLIILSQSAHNLSSSSAPDSDPSYKTIRTKRYIDINHKKHEANSQILKVTFEKSHSDSDNMSKHVAKNHDKITKLVMNGLGLKKLPDIKKANISQIEYSSKYLEYLERLRMREVRENSGDQRDDPASLQILSIVTNKFKDITRRRWRHKRLARSAEERGRGMGMGLRVGVGVGVGGGRKSSHGRNLGESEKTNILLQFPLRLNDKQFKYEQINEANVRLMMLYNPALAATPTARANKRKILENRHYEKPVRTGPKNCNNDDNYSYQKQQHKLHQKKQQQPQQQQQQQQHKLNNRKNKIHVLNLRVFQLMRSNKRQQLDSRRIEFEGSTYRDETRSQWLEFDVTAAVRSWLNKSHENLGIEIQCDRCRRIGARILSEVSSHSTDDGEKEEEEDKFHLTPVLNIIGHIGRTHTEEAVHPRTFLSANQSDEHLYHHRLSHGHTDEIVKSNQYNNCFRTHQRCCRHQLEVNFKEIQGFEFIIQPKSFDAGYCKGRCPPRHNPAHHHALLQSLIWQQDPNRVPRPCCAPSKLAEIEILHVDEEHSDKLKISTWSNMQVLECACS